MRGDIRRVEQIAGQSSRYREEISVFAVSEE
jgi:hypothetical protein